MMKFPQYFMIWLEILDFDGMNLVILVNLVLLVNFCEPADSREFYDLGLSVNSLHSCESEDCGESTDSE